MQLGRSPSDVESEALAAAREKDLELYIRRSQDFKDVVDGIVRRAYDNKRRKIEDTYQKSIEREWKREETALKDAIAYFEAFLKKYPDTRPFTPDAMYRLGELYYDKSYHLYQKELEAYGDAMDRGAADNMDPPVKNFDGSVAEGLYTAWITLNNPKQYNSYTTEMVKGVIAAFTNASLDRSVVAVVFTGAGDRASEAAEPHDAQKAVLAHPGAVPCQPHGALLAHGGPGARRAGPLRGAGRAADCRHRYRRQDLSR